MSSLSLSYKKKKENHLFLGSFQEDKEIKFYDRVQLNLVEYANSKVLKLNIVSMTMKTYELLVSENLVKDKSCKITQYFKILHPI